MLALTFTANALPMIIGSLSGWLWLAGITARPRATSSRTSSAGTPSRAAMNAISAVISPARARCNWVPRSRTTPGRGGRPGMQIDRRVADRCTGRTCRRGRSARRWTGAPGGTAPARPHPVEVPVVLAAARDRAGGHRRIDDNDQLISSPYAGITRSGSYGRRPQPSSQRTGCALPCVDVCNASAVARRLSAGIGIAPRWFV